MQYTIRRVWLVAAAAVAAAASLASAAGLAPAPAPQAAERPIAAAELLSASWLRVARAPRLLREDGAEIVRFDERQDAGLLWNPSLPMQDGDIDVDLRGRDLPQKSFVGIAWRITADGAAQLVWLRPFNFRSPDPVRRSHSLQFATHPDNLGTGCAGSNRVSSRPSSHRRPIRPHGSTCTSSCAAAP